jgi:drug/metabolite transporter (DMT)-like permease
VRGYFYLLLVTVIWGTTFPVQKIIVGDVSPLFYNSIRFAIASLIAFLIWGKGDWKRGGILGIILALSYASQTAGLKITTASKNGFFTSLYVVLVPLVSWLIEGITPRLNHILGIVLAFFGSYLLSDGIKGFNFGDFLSALCGVGFAFHVVLITKFSQEVKETDLLTPQFVITSVLNLILATAGGFNMTLPALGVAAYTAIFATALGIWVQVKHQKDIGSNASALIFSGEPVFAMLFSYLMIHEVFSTSQIIGAILLVSAIILAGVKM